VVLFVFVLMLLGTDATDESRARRSIVAGWAGGLGLFSLIMLGAWRALRVYARGSIGKYGGLPEDFGSVKSVGHQLFSDALLPFELATALLIVAVVGAIAVAQHARKTVAGKQPTTSSAHRFFAGPIEPREHAPVTKEPMQ
jgi:NADH-quinone oxidoreductase subunit J